MNERPLQSLQFPLKKVQKTVLQFLICSICILISGITELAVILLLKESKSELFLYIIDDVNDNCGYLMKAACICTIIVGLLAILTHCLGCPGRLICSISCLLICPFGVMAIGIGEAASISLSNRQMYLRIVKMDTHYYQNRNILFQLSQDNTLGSEFQKTFKCCGMFSTKDWYMSNCNCMPLSCCRAENIDHCTTTFLDDQNSKLKLLGQDSAEFSSNIEPYIWSTECTTEIQRITSKLKNKWLITIGISAVFHCLLSIWYFHITSIMIRLSLSPVGNIQLKIFKAHWPTEEIKVKKEYINYARADPKDFLETETALDSDPEVSFVLDNEFSESRMSRIPQHLALAIADRNKEVLDLYHYHAGVEDGKTGSNVK